MSEKPSDEYCRWSSESGALPVKTDPGNFADSIGHNTSVVRREAEEEFDNVIAKAGRIRSISVKGTAAAAGDSDA